MGVVDCGFGNFEESLFEFVDSFSLWLKFLIALWIV